LEVNENKQPTASVSVILYVPDGIDEIVKLPPEVAISSPAGLPVAGPVQLT
jgi:hypothetical protein